MSLKYVPVQTVDTVKSREETGTQRQSEIQSMAKKDFTQSLRQPAYSLERLAKRPDTTACV